MAPTVLHNAFFPSPRTPTPTYTLSLHDALPIYSIEHASLIDDEGIRLAKEHGVYLVMDIYNDDYILGKAIENIHRSEEHTSELQSLRHLVCRLLLEKKKVHV